MSLTSLDHLAFPPLFFSTSTIRIDSDAGSSDDTTTDFPEGGCNEYDSDRGSAHDRSPPDDEPYLDSNDKMFLRGSYNEIFYEWYMKDQQKMIKKSKNVYETLIQEGQKQGIDNMEDWSKDIKAWLDKSIEEFGARNWNHNIRKLEAFLLRQGIPRDRLEEITNERYNTDSSDDEEF